MYKNFFKRVLDFSIALVTLVILSPIIIVLVIILTIANQGSPFFFQARPGFNEKIFKIIKFKTMNDKKDSNGLLLSDEQRLTTIGRFVRKTSLDELPQLINILKGDMSIVGPRPLLERYLPYYTAEEKLRHSVRSGVTGLAQVNGRNMLNWNDRLALDASYAKDISFLLDMKIILKTVWVVLNRKDIAVIPGQVFPPLDKYREKK